MSEEVYLVQVECPDYYCGCGGGHVVGIFTTREKAEEQKGSVTPISLDEVRRGRGLSRRPHDLSYDRGPAREGYGWT